MVSLLDCIKRVPSLLNNILANESTTFHCLEDGYEGRLNGMNELVLIGSGTSNNGCITARYLMEEASGVRVTVATPNEFLHSLTVRNPKALYVFVTQTGTSIMTGETLRYAKAQGFMHVVISESADTPIAKEADLFIPMGCGQEEYLMRTIGYSTTVLTLIMLGMAIGKMRGHLNEEAYGQWLTESRRASENIPALIEKTIKWTEENRRPMMRAHGIFLNGSGPLYGVALEGAVKLWEIPQVIAVGYELEEGLHGPNYGYDHNHCVIVLNDGGRDSQKASALGKYMKYEKQNGFIVGMNTADGQDLAFEPKGGHFKCLEFASVVQTLAYQLAIAQGRDLFKPSDHSVMNSYFRSHNA